MIPAAQALDLASKAKKITLRDFNEALEAELDWLIKYNAEQGNTNVTIQPASLSQNILKILPEKLRATVFADDIKNMGLESILVKIDNLCILNGYEFSKIDEVFFNISWKNPA